ncbi:MAG: ATP-binding cassette domain-containing protein [Desulfamplus sp.]|nr:ATP-binding cassette domain-containing protein [Desulfamplus sp.]MBF0390291.1 ATP-binding cassette domain-containing protein [Desulfamplus sp.]
MAYGSVVVQQNLDFTVNKGDIFIIMGGSGCGKSTLLKHLVGLQKPANGDIIYNVLSKNSSLEQKSSQKEINFWSATEKEQRLLMKNFGILYQSGALWSSMTLAENIALPLEAYTNLSASQIMELASLKLALVGLAGFEGYYPSEISGGMRKRAALARAMALDPDFLFFDEPSAGLDPVSARLLDDLILELKESFGSTIVVVTHELASIFAIGTNSVFLDPVTKTMIANGNPKELLESSKDERVINFLTRGEGRL